MPGIVGIIRRQPYEGLDRDLGLMVESMRHKGYYVGDRYVNQEMGLHIGWLSHPRQLGECMPLVSHDKRVILIIVGEHFPGLLKGPPQQTAMALSTASPKSCFAFTRSRKIGFLPPLTNGFAELPLMSALAKSPCSTTGTAWAAFIFMRGKISSFLRRRRSLCCGSVLHFAPLNPAHWSVTPLLQLRHGEQHPLQGRLAVAGRVIVGFRRRCGSPEAGLLRFCGLGATARPQVPKNFTRGLRKPFRESSPRI